MKAMFSEDYYRQFWDKFLEPVPGEDYINLEAELAKEMEAYKALMLPEDAQAVLEKVEAQKIADRCKALVLKERDVVKALNSGIASLGYRTQAQEIRARGELVKRFEFNCLQLRDFKQKHNIQ